MKYFVCSDIHSFYSPMIKALDEKGYDKDNPQHCLIILGDLFDRGDETLKVIDFIRSIPEERLILIRGNHEWFLLKLLERRLAIPADIKNGTVKTLAAVLKTDDDHARLKIFNEEVAVLKEKYEYFKFLLEIIDREVQYYELGDKIFVHGWIPTDFTDEGPRPLENWREAYGYQWYDASCLNGMYQAKQGCIIDGKTIFCGHWHTSYGNVRREKPGLTDAEYSKLEFENDKTFGIFSDEGITALDSCITFTNRMNVYVFEE